MNQVIIIPAFEPDNRLIDYIIDLQLHDFMQIVVIDDGSGMDYDAIFNSVRTIGADVIRYPLNRGKGVAIKCGIRAAIKKYGEDVSIITADSDGQHLVSDVVKISDALEEKEDVLILGTRGFSGADVPWKSKWGNRFTSFFFKLTNGISCPDTQTGLRGIPSSLTTLALEEDGSRYEYEMNFLMDAAVTAKFKYIPIETVYENNNASSHFRPFRDSLRVYGRMIRFTLSSLTGAVADYTLFFILTMCFTFPHVQTIFAATILARLGSGVVNFQMNRHFSFRSKEPATMQASRYFVLFVGQMILSAGFVSLLSYVVPSLLAKIIIDTVLFFISYILQKRWVFKKGVIHEKEKEKILVGDHI